MSGAGHRAPEPAARHARTFHLNKTDPLGLRPCDANFKAFNKFAHNDPDTTGDLHAIENFLRNAPKDPCLESLSTDGRGRAVLTIGNENAPNVLIMPATAGQDLRDGFMNTVIAVNSILNAAGPDLLVVAYLGYDTPSGLGSTSQQLQPDEAGALAQQFTWYRSRKQHVTGFGYSYGGQALANAFQSGAQADDVVLAGPWISSSDSFSGATRKWLASNIDDPSTTHLPTAGLRAQGYRLLSTKQTSGHNYLMLNESQSVNGDAAHNLVAIALGKFQDVRCASIDPDCRRGT